MKLVFENIKLKSELVFSRLNFFSESFGRELEVNSIESIGRFTIEDIIQVKKILNNRFILIFSIEYFYTYEKSFSFQWFGFKPKRQKRQTKASFRYKLEIFRYLNYLHNVIGTVNQEPIIHHEYLNEYFILFRPDNKITSFSTEKKLFKTIGLDLIFNYNSSVNDYSCMYKIPPPDT